MIFFLGMLGGSEVEKVASVCEKQPEVVMQKPHSCVAFYVGKEAKVGDFIKTYTTKHFRDIVRARGIDTAATCLLANSEYTSKAVFAVAKTFFMGMGDFRFAVALTTVSRNDELSIYIGAPSSAYLEGDTREYTEGVSFNEVRGGFTAQIPAHRQSCGNGSGTLNDCANASKEHYIHVFGKTTVSSFQSYHRNITNGV